MRDNSRAVRGCLNNRDGRYCRYCSTMYHRHRTPRHSKIRGKRQIVQYVKWENSLQEQAAMETPHA